jgi:predicted CoA-binding protein
MNKEKLRGILETVRTIAVIGAKDVPEPYRCLPNKASLL